MTLSPLSPVLHDALRRGQGQAAFNVIQIEHAEAFAAAAEQVGAPVVLQISENCVRYHGGLTAIGRATLAIAEECAQPVVVHLDHAEDLDLVRGAVALGFTSVMFDGSRLPDEENRSTTAAVVRQCRAAGVSVEAELGEVGGKDGVHAPGVRTDPADARRFVEDTGVDALAVAVGSSHAMAERTASLDDALIRRIGDEVGVPLVLHGSSGVPDEGLVRAVRAGMTKINMSTHLNRVLTQRLREELAASTSSDPRTYMAAGRSALTQEAARLLTLLRQGA